MTGFVVSIFPFRNPVSSKEAFEGLELDEGLVLITRPHRFDPHLTDEQLGHSPVPYVICATFEASLL